MQIQTKIKDHFIPSRLVESLKSENITHITEGGEQQEFAYASDQSANWSPSLRNNYLTSLLSTSTPRRFSRGSLHRCVNVHSCSIYKSRTGWKPGILCEERMGGDIVMHSRTASARVEKQGWESAVTFQQDEPRKQGE